VLANMRSTEADKYFERAINIRQCPSPLDIAFPRYLNDILCIAPIVSIDGKRVSEGKERLG